MGHLLKVRCVQQRVLVTLDNVREFPCFLGAGGSHKRLLPRFGMPANSRFKWVTPPLRATEGAYQSSWSISHSYLIVNGYERVMRVRYFVSYANQCLNPLIFNVNLT